MTPHLLITGIALLFACSCKNHPPSSRAPLPNEIYGVWKLSEATMALYKQSGADQLDYFGQIEFFSDGKCRLSFIAKGTHLIGDRTVMATWSLFEHSDRYSPFHGIRIGFSNAEETKSGTDVMILYFRADTMELWNFFLDPDDKEQIIYTKA